MGVFVSERSILIGLVCVQRGWGHAPGSTRLKVKCRHGSIELGIERAEACRMGFWGMGNQCDGSEELAPERSFVDSNLLEHTLFFFLRH